MMLPACVPAQPAVKASRAEPAATVVLSGYVEVSGQTIILFDDPAAAEGWDTGKCKTIAADKKVFDLLASRHGTLVTIAAANLGKEYWNSYLSKGSGYLRIKGRVIDMWCHDPNLYWAASLR